MEEKEFLGCGSHSCRIEKPKGMGTNGPCGCLRDLPTAHRIRLEKAISRMQREIKALKEENENLKRDN